MAHTIEQFAQQCSTILRADPGPAGRQKVCDLLKEVLKDKEFVANMDKVKRLKFEVAA
jgi:hypothetical protein